MGDDYKGLTKEELIREKYLEWKFFLELAGNDPFEVLTKLSEIKKILSEETHN